MITYTINLTIKFVAGACFNHVSVKRFNSTLNSYYRSLLRCVEQSSTIHRVSNVEGMVIRAVSRDSASVNEEGVCSTSLHNQLWDDCVVDVPSNTPTSLS